MLDIMIMCMYETARHAGALKIRKFNIVNATRKHTATLFFFHGSGSSGDDAKQWIDILLREELKFPHIKIVYPTAPAQPYTPIHGMHSNVWFDRKTIDINAPEQLDSIDQICKNVVELIDTEVAQGIPHENIAVSGFSMGGALSMYLAYRYKTSVAGCAAMSSFLNRNSTVYEYLKTNPGNMPPLLQYHGTKDALVSVQWAEETYNNLKEFGVKGQFKLLDGRHHELTSSQIKSFKSWVLDILPEK
ncbi:lysophospholipase-like protein 1 isoform X2 [Augochlora pura]